MKSMLLIIVVSLLLFACNRHLQHARIVLLPDTQTYAEKYPYILDSQINWIIRNQKDIDLVLQQGDLTQNNNDTEWKLVQQDFGKLNGLVPYVLAAGNHDMGSGPGKFADVRNTTLFNQYFPTATMSNLPGYAGQFEQGKIENAYYLFKTGNVDWLILTLEFGPRNTVLDWANKIVEQHPKRLVIVNTHAYMYSDSTRQNQNDWWRPQAYGVGKDTGTNAVNDGEQIWNKLIKKHPNIRFVFSGHVLKTGVGTLVSINQQGYPVYQMLANYQEGVDGSVNGGNGWLRILDMKFKKRTLKVATYSPFLNRNNEDPAHNFIIKNVMYTPQ